MTSSRYVLLYTRIILLDLPHSCPSSYQEAICFYNFNITKRTAIFLFPDFDFSVIIFPPVRNYMPVGNDTAPPQLQKGPCIRILIKISPEGMKAQEMHLEQTMLNGMAGAEQYRKSFFLMFLCIKLITISNI